MRNRLTAATLAATLALTGLVIPARAGVYWQCVTFARMMSGIQLFGDAATWWEKAVGHYARGAAPESGAVLVFKPNAHMRQGHVAVVSHVFTDRIIEITHANWSPIDGRRGQVEKDVAVVDVSPRGDWSQVKVWYDPLGDVGQTVYPTYGFIYRGDGVQPAAAHVRAEASAAGATPLALR